jgi:hypothetical protein
MVISNGLLWTWLWNFRFHNCCSILGSWEIIIFPRTLVEGGTELSQLINQKVVRCLDGPVMNVYRRQADCTSDFAEWSLLKLIDSRDGARVCLWGTAVCSGRNVNPPDFTFKKIEHLCTKEWRGKSSKFVEKYAPVPLSPPQICPSAIRSTTTLSKCHSVHYNSVPVPFGPLQLCPSAIQSTIMLSQCHSVHHTCPCAIWPTTNLSQFHCVTAVPCKRHPKSESVPTLYGPLSHTVRTINTTQHLLIYSQLQFLYARGEGTTLFHTDQQACPNSPY